MKMKMKKGTWLYIAILLLFGAVPALAATAQEELIAAQAEQEATMSALVAVQERMAVLEEKKGESEAYLLELNKQITELNEELEEIQQQYSEKQHEFDIASQELANAELDKERQRENMAIRIQYMYENSMDAGILEAVFSADSFTELLTRAENMSELTNYDREMLEEYEAICQTVEERKAKVEAEQLEIDMLRDAVESKREEMVLLSENTRSEVEKLAGELQSSESEAVALIGQIEQQQAQIVWLSAEVSAQAAAAEAAAAQAQAEAQAAQQAQAQAEAQAAQAAAQPAATQPATQPAAEAPEAAGAETAAPAEGGATEAAVPEEEENRWSGPVLTRSAGVNAGPTGKETYYNLPMGGVVNIMRNMGNNDEYWVREDGVKMLGDYVMVAANLETHPRGSLVESSLGTAIVCDTGGFAADNPEQLDIATAW